MNKALFNRRVRQLHLWFGLAIGVQVGLWLVSGLFMTWFPIEQVRGDHLKTKIEASTLTDLSLLRAPDEIAKISQMSPETMIIKNLDGKAVWFVENSTDKVLINAQSGNIISPLSQELAQKIASSHYSGGGDVVLAELLETPPREYGRDGPVWRVNFGKPATASFYVDATTGDVKAVRTGLWRTFDFMWGLHIMDWSNRENFNSWWIKMTASLAIIFFLSGVCLAVLRISSMLARRQKTTKQSGSLSK